MSFTWQHIEFEDGSNPYISKTEEDFNWMKNKYELEFIKDNFWLAKSYKRISDWLEIEYREATEEMKEYLDEEEYFQPGFEWDDIFYYLDDFVRTHSNPWSNMHTPTYIHGYDSTDWCNPLFIELADSGDAVRLYERVTD